MIYSLFIGIFLVNALLDDTETYTGPPQQAIFPLPEKIYGPVKRLKSIYYCHDVYPPRLGCEQKFDKLETKRGYTIIDVRIERFVSIEGKDKVGDRERFWEIIKIDRSIRGYDPKHPLQSYFQLDLVLKDEEILEETAYTRNVKTKQWEMSYRASFSYSPRATTISLTREKNKAPVHIVAYFLGPKIQHNDPYRVNFIDKNNSLLRFTRKENAAWAFYNGIGLKVTKSEFDKIWPHTEPLFRFSHHPYGVHRKKYQPLDLWPFYTKPKSIK